jgi:hypothetical protein
MKRIIKFITAIVFISAPCIVFAMGSTNYKINADVIGASGALGSSSNYKLNDTIGEPVAGIGSSSSYQLQQGFQYMINTGISLTVDSNTKNLGSVNPGSSASGQSTLTVTTDSWGGYDTLLSENHAMLHTDAVTTIPDYSCAINSPCVWSGNGFGFTVISGTGVEAKWGTSPNYNYAAAPLADTVFHTKTGYTSGGDQTVVGYNVAPATSQKSGTYSNVILYTVLAKI